MNSAITSIILLTCLVTAAVLGQRLQRRLPDHHLSADSKDAVKLAVGLVATMTALLLGLLAFSAKGTYDTRRTEIIEIAAKVTFLDRMLTAYGPDAAKARAQFREAVAEGVRSAQANAAAGRAHMFPLTQTDYRSYAAILALSPEDDMQRDLKARALSLAVDVQQPIDDKPLSFGSSTFLSGFEEVSEGRSVWIKNVGFETAMSRLMAKAVNDHIT